MTWAHHGVVVLAWFTGTLAAYSAQPLPTASNILQRVVQRAQLIARAVQTNHYTYEKKSLTEEFDDKEHITKTTEKLYRVALIGGLPFPRLVKIQGRELSARDLEKENQRETAFRQRV